ncbi:unnamed protein product [Agarophyton chilense]|eukprot:gb/GEZJ01002298.1/.p1 GENE.gb/GEZJ01002298.1/~~gb/GEZJ01002298.1/.p1  ORF type:complete len:691 (-),score=87.54 gb/GEZJ01002298.1/:530-2602(-)
MAASIADSIAQVNPFNCDTKADPSYVANYFGLEIYKCATQFFTDAPLPSWTGWVVVLAFGVVFGLFTVGLVYLEQYITGVSMNSEFFNTAGRTVKIGLTASVLVSQWTWAATLLKSSSVAYDYGVSGPFWYASGATIQILLFSMLAVLVKRRAPSCHTFLEIVRARWGKPAHIVFVVFAFMTNIIVTSMLILGGSAVVSALTGMNTDLASFLIPLGVILYTLAGGLKATFIASYFNTAVILIALCIFIFEVYVFSDELGSPGKVWDNLNAINGLPGTAGKVDGNYQGSYLTMLSRDGLFFGLTNIVGNFGTVFVDQSYWQSAIAATPSASWKGYIIGGLCWFAIPFSLATSLGLAALALSLPLSDGEIDAGLVPPAVATHLLGSGGAALILIMLFMAVTSTGAAEQIAVSSLVSYDVYRTYINPNATGRQIIFVSRVAIVVFGVLMGVFGIVLNAIGVKIGFLYLFMGVMIGSAVVPVAFSISWSKCSGLAAMCGAIGGLALGFTTWIVYGAIDGGVSVENLGEDRIMLAGNLVSILSSGAICIFVSLFIKGDNCDWSNTKSIALVEEDENAVVSEETDAELARAQKLIMAWGVGLTLVLVVLWPLLALPARAFSKGYFTFWVILSFIWGIIATVVMVTLPVYESFNTILSAVRGKKMGKNMDEESMMDTGKSMTDTVAESEMTARSLEM